MFPPETATRRKKPLGSQPGYQRHAPATSIATGPAGAGLVLESGGNIAAILTKLADPATQVTLAAVLTAIGATNTALGTANGHLSTIETNTTPP